VPAYMTMGDKGMADMAEMEMPLPDNTLPMMTGTGQYGAIEMGGMFTLVKIREGLDKNDYKDPGWYKHPEGTLAYPWSGEMPPQTRAELSSLTASVEMTVRKPDRMTGHH
jgi:manganese oxidase